MSSDEALALMVTLSAAASQSEKELLSSFFTCMFQLTFILDHFIHTDWMKKTRRHFTDSSNGDDVFNIFSETQAFILVCKSLETSLIRTCVFVARKMGKLASCWNKWAWRSVLAMTNLIVQLLVCRNHPPAFLNGIQNHSLDVGCL